jgi:hypothetical protein
LTICESATTFARHSQTSTSTVALREGRHAALEDEDHPASRQIESTINSAARAIDL